MLLSLLSRLTHVFDACLGMTLIWELLCWPSVITLYSRYSFTALSPRDQIDPLNHYAILHFTKTISL